VAFGWLPTLTDDWFQWDAKHRAKLRDFDILNPNSAFPSVGTGAIAGVVQQLSPWVDFGVLLNFAVLATCCAANTVKVYAIRASVLVRPELLNW